MGNAGSGWEGWREGQAYDEKDGLLVLAATGHSLTLVATGRKKKRRGGSGA